MKTFFAIASLLCSSYLLAQGRLLKTASFRKVELSREWIIVKYRPQTSPVPNAQVLHVNATPSQKSVLDGMVKIPLGANQNPIDICNKLLADPNVIYAEPVVKNYLLETTDPLVDDQYYLAQIQAFDAWNITRGDDDIAIAIIDTGIDLDHEDLVVKLWLNENDTIDGIDNDENGYIDDYFGYDFSDADNDPTADNNPHGTQVAGVAGATTNNELGVAGVGYNTKIAALKGFSSDSGQGIGLFDAIMYAADNGIEVLNLSWGSIREPLQSEQDIINYAVLEKNVVVVAAAGNDGTKPTAEEKFYPASYDNVLSVGGSISDDSKWSGSSYNHAVDLIAPAFGILTTSNGDAYNTSAQGTSFASPMVAAVAALVMDQFPKLTAQQIMERVRVTADDIYEVGSNIDFDGKLGRGRLNAFRAVNDGNLKSIRAENLIVEKSTSDPVFYGDTLTISVDLVNYLQPLNDLVVYLSSPEGEFYTTVQSFFPAPIGTLGSQTFSFEILLSELLEPETNVDLRLDFQDGAYSDFQLLDIETSPNYAAFGNNNAALSIAGDGRLGIMDYENGIGSGLLYQSNTILSHTGIVIATSNEEVSDNIISNFETPVRDNDFTANTYFKIQHHPFADRYAYSAFTDETHNLLLEQSNIAADTSTFIINRYRIVNVGTDTLKSLSFGVFADWDLAESTENYAEYDLTENYLFVRDNDATQYAGTMIRGNGTLNFSALDLDELNGNTQDVGPLFNDSIKYHYLVSQTILSAGEIGVGNDVAGIHGITIDLLAPNSFEYLDLIFAAANTKTDLSNTFQHAQEYLSTYHENPTVSETILTCEGGTTIINPAEGDQFIFYVDALGTQLIDTANTLAPSITTDTSFYVRNLDLAYPSDISEIRVRLFEDIANFKMDQDTLYLDHPTTNIVHFIDQSIDPVSWNWDFGQGTQSTLQNPLISFNQEGVYPISLIVENTFGCVDSFTKNLVVANRPGNLVFEEINLCPNEIGSVSEASASVLFLYSTASQQQPLSSGAEVQIGPYQQDTIVFISGRVNGFLTNRTQVNINIGEVIADFAITPDTISDGFNLVVRSIVEDNASFEWFVNDLAAGADSIITVEALQGIQTVELRVISESNCEVTVRKTFEVSSSPTPELSDDVGCAGTPVILKPQNGTYFGFYSDAELNNLLAKGTQLVVTEDSQVFVVGLDDGLPGTAIQANISFELFDPKIEIESARVGTKNKVQLNVASDIEIQSYQWYVDNEESEVSSSPIYFFDEIEVEIVLEAISINGCSSSDTIHLDFTPPIIPLGADIHKLIKIHPNPTSGTVMISEYMSIDNIIIRDLTGKELMVFEKPPGTIDLTRLTHGLYILEVISGVHSQLLKIVLE